MEEIVNFKWSGKYVKILILFVHVSVGEVKRLYGLMRLEMVNNPNYSGSEGRIIEVKRYTL